MTQAFENFTLFYALSLASNTPASSTLKIVGGTDGVQLVYCIPNEFAKRVTDTSNALALDKTEPDTGTGRSSIEIMFTQSRESAPSNDMVDTLLKMFYTKSNDPIFRKGRFGLSNTDNPGLNANPTAVGGYKFTGFKQVPNKDEPALLKYIVTLSFVGDHTILGAFS